MWYSDFIYVLKHEVGVFIQEHLGLESPSARFHRQLRIMFGAGEIDRETFFKLRGLLMQGYYIEGEMKTLHRQAARRMQLEGRPQQALTGEYRRALDQVYYNRAIIVEARYQVKQALAVIEESHRWLLQRAKQQAETPEGASIPVTAPALPPGVLSDKDAARIFGIKPVKLGKMPIQPGGVNDYLSILAQRKEAGDRELKRLDLLEEQLRFYEAELMVAQSRDFLQRVEAAVRRQIE